MSNIPQEKLIDAIKNFVRVEIKDKDTHYHLDLDRVGILAKHCGFERTRDLLYLWGLKPKDEHIR